MHIYIYEYIYIYIYVYILIQMRLYGGPFQMGGLFQFRTRYSDYCSLGPIFGTVSSFIELSFVPLGFVPLGFGSLNHGIWPSKRVFGIQNLGVQTLRVQT